MRRFFLLYLKNFQSAVTLSGDLSLNTATIDLDNTIATRGGSVDLDVTTSVDLAAAEQC